jgi:DNA repair exonuclease SbcCD ATPase subunit
MEVKQKVNDIDQSLSQLNENHREILQELKSLREENHNLKEQQIGMNKRQQKLEEENASLCERLSELEQYGRRINLEIHGIELKPKHGGEKEDVTEVLKDIASKINVRYNPDYIQKAHRLQNSQQNKPPTLLVQFTSSEVRDNWLKAGKRAKLLEVNTNRKIFFNENLTQYYRKLLGETKRCAATHGYSYVWIQNGKILVRKQDSDRSVIVVKHFRDLRKIGLSSLEQPK